MELSVPFFPVFVTYFLCGGAKSKINIININMKYDGRICTFMVGGRFFLRTQ